MSLKIQHNISDLHKKNVVYEIECLITGDKYIGKTSNMKKRMMLHEGCHSKSSKSGCNTRTPLYQDTKKYGWENFRLSILAENINQKYFLGFVEKFCQDKIEYSKYMSAQKNRNTSPKRTLHYCKFSKQNEELVFKNPMEATNYFTKIYKKDFDRTSVLKSISNGYLFNKEWKAEYISEDEYLSKGGITSLF